MKKILIIDGNSLMYKGFYGTYYGNNKIMQTSKGIPTNAVYAFTNSLFKVLKFDDYYDVKVAFDMGKKTFRHDFMEDYKGGRKETPADLIPQFKIVREMLDAANISWFEMENIEADDLIGSLTKKIEENTDYYVDILTTDKDMYQLVDNRVSIIKTSASGVSRVTALEIKNDWNIEPYQVPDWKGIAGDSSDNIKGVKGIGTKGASDLLSKYKTLENIYENLDNIKESVRAKLINDKDNAFLSKKVATIITNVDVRLELNGLDINDLQLEKFLIKYEMNSFLKNIKEKVSLVNIEQFKEPISVKKFEAYMFTEHNYLFLDTFSENYNNTDIIGIALSNESGTHVFQNERLDIFNWRDTNLIDEDFQKFLLDENKIKYVYDIKKTISSLIKIGYKVSEKSFKFDFMLASYLIDSTTKSNFANHINLLSHGAIELSSKDSLFGKTIKNIQYVDQEAKKNYLGECAYSLKKLYNETLVQLKEMNLYNLLIKIEIPLAFCLMHMEFNGLLIDRQELELQKNKIGKQLEEITAIIKGKLNEYIDEDFNLASPKQLGDVLYNKMKLPDKSKKQSTDIESLQNLVNQHPVIQDVMTYRKLYKLYSVYLKGFEKYIYSDNKVRTIYNQGLAQTGRLSSSDPNLQNIAVRDEAQRKVRKIFIPTSNKKFISFDYSQVELRMIAQLAPEHNLIEAFNNDVDIHKQTAKLMFNLENTTQVTYEQRSIAKTINFSILYGKTAYGLSQELNISHKQAVDFINMYNNAYPEVIKYKDNLIANALRYGYAETITGRKRLVNELQSTNINIKNFGERIAVNMPVQGSAADLLKAAMINIEKKLQNNKLNANMLLQIHDELIFEVDPNDIDKLSEIVIYEMENAFKWIINEFDLNTKQLVDFKVSTAVGNNLYELK